MNPYTRARLQQLEQEAHRLRAEHARDLLATAAIRFDLAVRRLAYRLAGPWSRS